MHKTPEIENIAVVYPYSIGRGNVLKCVLDERGHDLSVHDLLSRITSVHFGEIVSKTSKYMIPFTS